MSRADEMLADLDGIRFGFELEIADNAEQVRQNLYEMNLTAHDCFHEYHCSCLECSYGRDNSTRYLFAAQDDCTCDGEFITRILRFGGAAHKRAIEGISAAALLANADTTSSDVGNHVHVERDVFARALEQGYPGTEAGNHYSYRTSTERDLYRLFAHYSDELDVLARGPQRAVREYNDRPYRESPSDDNCGSWLMRKSRTNEFRLWNSTKAPWRIHLHVAVSVAMTLAAIDGVAPQRLDKGQTLGDTLGPYLSDEGWAGLLIQADAKEVKAA